MNRWIVRGLVTAGFAGGIWLLSAGTAQAQDCGCPATGSALPLGVVSGLLSSAADDEPTGVTATVKVAVGATVKAHTDPDPDPDADVDADVDADAVVSIGGGADTSGSSGPAPSGSGGAAAGVDAEATVAEPAAVDVDAEFGLDVDTDGGASTGPSTGPGTGGAGAGMGVDLAVDLLAGFGPRIGSAPLTDAATTPLATDTLPMTGVTWSRTLWGALLLATGLLMYCTGRTTEELTP
jgi:hypothetical protein